MAKVSDWKVFIDREINKPQSWPLSAGTLKDCLVFYFTPGGKFPIKVTGGKEFLGLPPGMYGAIGTGGTVQFSGKHFTGYVLPGFLVGVKPVVGGVPPDGKLKGITYRLLKKGEKLQVGDLVLMWAHPSSWPKPEGLKWLVHHPRVWWRWGYPRWPWNWWWCWYKYAYKPPAYWYYYYWGPWYYGWPYYYRFWVKGWWWGIGVGVVTQPGTALENFVERNAGAIVIRPTVVVELPPKPAAPRTLWLTTGRTDIELDKHSILAEWSYVKRAVKYNVYISSNGVNYSLYKTVHWATRWRNGQWPNTLITGLQPGTRYWVKVTGVDARGREGPPVVGTATTDSPDPAVYPSPPGTPPQPATPLRLYADSPQPGRVRLWFRTDTEHNYYGLAVAEEKPGGKASSGWQYSGHRAIRTAITKYEDTVIVWELENDRWSIPGMTYRFKVYAGDCPRKKWGTYFNCKKRDYSNTVEVTVMKAPPPSLPPPSLDAQGLGAFGKADHILVKWARVEHAGSYKLQRSTDKEHWTVVATVQDDGSATYSYKDTDVESGVIYYYRVKAFPAGTDYSPSRWSAVVSAKLTGNQADVPAAPTLSVVSLSWKSVGLSWTNVADEDGYKVERSEDGGTTWAVVGTTGANEVSFVDLSVKPGRAYTYRVIAYNGAGDGTPSNTVQVTTAASPPSPPQPQMLDAPQLSAEGGANSITLTWPDVEFAAKYLIQRSVNQAEWENLAEVYDHQDSESYSYTDEDVEEGNVYYYRARSLADMDGFADSGWSEYVSAQLSGDQAEPPSAPQNLKAEVLSWSHVRLIWDNVADEDGYKIERSDDGGTTWVQIGTVAADHVVYNDVTTHGEKTYQYRVKAYNAAGDSAPSNVVEVTTPEEFTFGHIAVVEVHGREDQRSGAVDFPEWFDALTAELAGRTETFGLLLHLDGWESERIYDEQQRLITSYKDVIEFWAIPAGRVGEVDEKAHVFRTEQEYQERLKELLGADVEEG